VKRKGFFITFEGAEGSGKSTLIHAARRFLQRKGFKVLILREPGGTVISEKIRNILLDRKNSRMTVEAELFLYLAARAQIVREKILPALKQGRIVICDRYHDSTMAYQGYAARLSLKMIESFGKLAKGTLEPHLTILLDVETKKGLKRGGRIDRMERKSILFHKRVRRGFLLLAKKNQGRIVLVRDRGSVRDKSIQIENILSKFLELVS